MIKLEWVQKAWGIVLRSINNRKPTVTKISMILFPLQLCLPEMHMRITCVAGVLSRWASLVILPIRPANRDKALGSIRLYLPVTVCLYLLTHLQ